MSQAFMKPRFVGKARRCRKRAEERPQDVMGRRQVYWIHPDPLGQIRPLARHLLELLGEFRIRDFHSLDEIFDAPRICDASQRMPKKRQVADQRPNPQRDNKGQNGQRESQPFGQFALQPEPISMRHAVGLFFAYRPSTILGTR